MSIDLNNKRILVTRNEPKASEFADLITRYGGQPIVTPLIKINCQYEMNHEKCLDKLDTYEWIIFTSANGVRCFFEKLKAMGDNALNEQTRFAVVGPKTNQALQQFGYEAEFIPSVYNAKTMAPELLEKYKITGPVLLVQGQLSKTVINEALYKSGIPFDCIKVYKLVTNVVEKTHLRDVSETGRLDFITFMSPSTVDAFMDLAGDLRLSKSTHIVCVGTTTAKRVYEYGFQKVLIPDEFTVEGMMEKMSEQIDRERRDGRYGKESI